MPEGDTVFLTARRLTEELAGKVLVRGELRHPRLSTIDLAGRTVLGARSVGKHLFLRFDRELSLHHHLVMDGSWRFFRARAPVDHATRVLLATASTTALGRNLHQLALLPTADEHTLVAHLGPDLLDPDWSPDHAAEAADRLGRDPDREIGLALLDQRVLAGVGNVYKAEVCYLLGVSPWTPVSEVDTAKAVELSRDLLLRNTVPPRPHPPAGGRGAGPPPAYHDRSTTGDPRRDRRLWVYGRTRTGCLRCNGRIVATTQGTDTRERVTYFCPRCQPGPHPT